MGPICVSANASPRAHEASSTLADISYSGVLKDTQSRIGDFLTPSVRLGVTGLSRAGKTVFITALVRNLISGGRLPFFTPDAEGRIIRCYLEPQPDDAIPRFDYEAHLAQLLAVDPSWPESTRRISELRVTIEYRSNNPLKRALGISKLHIDIVDYPGEWLVDLAMLGTNYAKFSEDALSLASEPSRAAASKPFRDFLAGTDPAAAASEQIALTGARLFTEYLAAAKKESSAATLAPGRFLLPGDLEGSPLLTFFPMPEIGVAAFPKGSLGAMMERRYESYKTDVVQPFFRAHFARLDRQIVLVDVLGALDRGAAAIADLERTMTGVLAAFRPGSNSWLSLFLGRRIDRVLFAATKADHLPSSSHDRLEALLSCVVEAARERSESEGAGVATMAISALRATREAEAKSGGERIPCLRGVPIAGEKIGKQTFDGRQEAAIFPGDLPADPVIALANARTAKPGSLSLVRFRPPSQATVLEVDGKPAIFPHIRMDRALEFLIADYLT